MLLVLNKIREASSDEDKMQELKNDLSKTKDRIIELEANGKSMYDQYKSMESEHKATIKERDNLTTRVSKYEESEERREKQSQDSIGKLESAKEALGDEKKRIRHEDEERLTQEKETWDRMWNDHEQNVIALMNELCKKPQLSFATYDNKNLPEGFHGQLKPDFLIAFLKQYVIFDPKVSRSGDINAYIRNQVQKTAEKVKGNDQIFPTIFLIVPTEAISQMKNLQFYEEGYHFFIISPEAIAPILASFKRIETYEFAEQMDPQERENIIDTLAAFDSHISQRNAADFLLMQHGLQTLDKAQSLNPDIAKEVAMRKIKTRNLNLNTAEHKQLTANPETLQERLRELVEPKAQIKKEELENLQKSE